MAIGMVTVFSIGCADYEAIDVPDLPPMTPITTELRSYYDVEYSPDGTRITYAATEADGQAIWVAQADGSNPRRISPVTTYAFDPAWSVDGQEVVFSTTLAGRPPFIAAVPAAGGDWRALTSGETVEYYPKVSPDGTEVLFRGNAAGNFDVWVARFEGGEPRQITTSPGSESAHDWAPDGRHIAFWRNEGGRRTVWLHSVEDGSERELTSEGFESFGGTGWSPDSRELIVYSARTGAPDIWVYPVDGGEPRQLTSDIRSDGLASYSPDGRWILFRSERGGQDDVWIVSAEGGDAIRVTDDPAEEADLRWRPDGRGVLFARDEGVQQGFALNVATGDVRQITVGDEDRTLHDVSPDGLRAVLIVEASGNDDLHTVPTEGGESSVLVASPVDEVDPRWSPDGSRIAFRSNRGSGFNIFVVPAEGGDAVPLTTVPSGLPVWSPSGDRIAYTASGPTGTNDVWVVPAEGGEPTRLTDGGGVIGGLTWSPDGSSVTYFGTLGDAGEGQGIYSVSATGGPPVALITEGADFLAPSSPTWSPDGTQIAFHAPTRGDDLIQFDIYVADADGSNIRRLTDHPAFDQTPAWSQDGSRIYFHTRRGSETDNGGDLDLAVVSVEGGDARVLWETPHDEFLRPWIPVEDELFFNQTPRGNELVIVEVGELLDAAEARMADGAGA